MDHLAMIARAGTNYPVTNFTQREQEERWSKYEDYASETLYAKDRLNHANQL